MAKQKNMSIILSACYNESDDSTNFNIQEVTGLYNNPNNLGGWDPTGINNPSIASVTAATITISQLSDPALSIYTVPVVINVFPILPNTANTLATITAVQAGYGQSPVTFPDGIYQIVYSVTSNLGVIAPVTQFKVFSGLIDCCIKKMADNLSICSCNCSGLQEQLKEAMFWKRLLNAASCCGNINACFKFIEKLIKMCSNCNCT